MSAEAKTVVIIKGREAAFSPPITRTAMLNHPKEWVGRPQFAASLFIFDVSMMRVPMPVNEGDIKIESQTPDTQG